MNGLKRLQNSAKFWVLLIAFGQSILFHYVPNFPEEIWQGFNNLALVVIAAIAVEDAATKFNSK